MMTELLDLLTDPAHLAFEALTGLAEFAAASIFGAVWLRHHDKKHHAPAAAAPFRVTGPQIRWDYGGRFNKSPNLDYGLASVAERMGRDLAEQIPDWVSEDWLARQRGRQVDRQERTEDVTQAERDFVADRDYWYGEEAI